MLVVNTVVAKGPIIFVSLAQADTGEMDVWYIASTYEATYDGPNMNQYLEIKDTFNFT